jgi:hypothetical protein
VARPALRDHALRQRDARVGLCRGLPPDGGSAVRAGRPRHRRLRPAGDDLARRLVGR